MADPHPNHNLLLAKILLLSYPVIADNSSRPDLHNTSVVQMEDPFFEWGEHIAIWLTLNLLAPYPGTEGRPRPVQGGQHITKEYLRGLPSRSCVWAFWFTVDQLVDLTEALDIQEPIYTENSHKSKPLEAVALLYTCYCHSGDLYDFIEKYDHSASLLSQMIIDVVKYLDEWWKHLLNFDHQFILSLAKMAEYAEAIRNRGSPIWTLFGFIDCMICCITRPTWFQMADYNGHKKIHMLKYQAIMLPNELIGHLSGPMEGRRHDVWMLEESHFFEHCEAHALVPGTGPNNPVEERFYQVSGDSAYGVGPHIQSNIHSSGQQTEDERAFNAKIDGQTLAMSGIGLVKKIIALFDLRKQLLKSLSLKNLSPSPSLLLILADMLEECLYFFGDDDAFVAKSE
ncbi:unnamed protein product [Peniophora sp. CBMAI 1063]|nr:unnamed protein product [Peniophora sp. CBMAI 1063]